MPNMVEEFRERDSSPEITLVIGGGQSGLKWARQNHRFEERTICVDQQELASFDSCFLQGDVLKLFLAVKKGSVKKIYADFLFNATGREVGKEKLTVREVLADPQLLLSEAFPPNVRDWFLHSAGGVINTERGDWLKVNELMKQSALQQMWNVLKVGGEIIVLDRRYIIDWLVSGPVEILHVNSWEVKITRLKIDSEDWKRSHSLNKIVTEWGQPISCLGKIHLQKIDDYPVLFPPWYRDAD